MKEEIKKFLRENCELCVDSKGRLCDTVYFDKDIVLYQVNGITEHMIFGIYFSFNSVKP
jgi:hypothetical protein